MSFKWDAIPHFVILTQKREKEINACRDERKQKRR
jgi:hypothetical protein